MVEPGGLREKGDVKILICYLLSRAEMPLSFDAVTQITQSDGMVNYFDFSEAMRELLMSGHIDLTGDGLYTITPYGRENGEQLYSVLPVSVKEKAIRASILLQAKIRRESENTCEISEVPGGYRADCRIRDRDEDLMSLSVLLADRPQAEAFRKRFLERPESLYQGVFGWVME